MTLKARYHVTISTPSLSLPPTDGQLLWHGTVSAGSYFDALVEAMRLLRVYNLEVPNGLHISICQIDDQGGSANE